MIRRWAHLRQLHKEEDEDRLVGNRVMEGERDIQQKCSGNMKYEVILRDIVKVVGIRKSKE